MSRKFLNFVASLRCVFVCTGRSKNTSILINLFIPVLFKRKQLWEEKPGAAFHPVNAATLHELLYAYAGAVMLGIGKNVQIQRTEKQTLFVGTKLILGAERGEYKKIDQRPERLYQVIGKVKCVHRAFMVYSENGQQTVHRQRAGDAAPDDGIAVIERGIVYAVVPPREAFPEENGEIKARRSSFYVPHVARTDALRHCFQGLAVMLIPAVFQAKCLIGDLCLDYGLPHPLFQRFTRRKLLFDDGGLTAVLHEWGENCTG